ncbi:MAG TPA: IS110 family transposase [Albitalea sp.]
MNATTVAVDLAKDVFEVAIAGPHGQVTQRLRLSRARFRQLLHHQPPANVVMEACGTAHYWGRVADACGHRVCLLPPRDVRPYVRRDKTDRADAAGLLEAARCAEIHPVPVKSTAQQEVQALHAVRRQWVGTRTARINVLRGLLREFGIVFGQGAATVRRKVPEHLADEALPGRLRTLLTTLFDEIRELDQRIDSVDTALRDFARSEPIVQRLDAISGIGVLTATALWASVGEIQRFRRARQFSAWLGLPPREHSSGTRRRLGPMSKRGDPYLRTLLIHGARSVLFAARRRQRGGRVPLDALQRWALACGERRGMNRAAVAVANKLARITWAVWRHERRYGPETWPHRST